MPCLYIKIVPLMAWGANFNFSIWFVEVRGVEEAQVVRKAMESYHLVCYPPGIFHFIQHF